MRSMLHYKCSLTRDFMAATLIAGERGPQVLEKVVWQRYFVTDCLKKLKKKKKCNSFREFFLKVKIMI